MKLGFWVVLAVGRGVALVLGSTSFRAVNGEAVT